MCWANIAPPPTQNSPFVRSCRPTFGQQEYINCWDLSVGPMFSQCLHANNDILPTTSTLIPKLQPLPNVGPMIACYLGYLQNFIIKPSPEQKINSLNIFFFISNSLRITALIAIRQLGFFNVPHRLWNRTNGHVLGTVTPTFIASLYIWAWWKKVQVDMYIVLW